jgi:D-alanine-D-alanine ligase
MNQKIRLGLVCGGVSCEHDVSLASAKSVLEAIDLSKYEVELFFIDKKGRWFPLEASLLFRESFEALLSGNSSFSNSLEVSHNPGILLERDLDVIFPLLHGPYGEDGTIQGFFSLMKLPFVGASVIGSAIGMDKDVMKRLLRDAGLPIARFRTIRASETLDLDKVIEDLGLPLFVKPSNLGSSLGVSKAKNREELEEAVTTAFEYDNKILVEEHIPGRELECGVLGNENPMVSTVGEVVTSYDFYTYEAKYLDQKLRLEIPADIPHEVILAAQKLAKATFQVLCCEGMARIDFFLKDNGELIVNEINTIPGFTPSSMYPKLWEAGGVSYAELIDRVIALAIARNCVRFHQYISCKKKII